MSYDIIDELRGSKVIYDVAMMLFFFRKIGICMSRIYFDINIQCGWLLRVGSERESEVR